VERACHSFAFQLRASLTYWLYASAPEAACALVASNVPEDDAAREAQDATKYDCLPDETKTPPRRFIYRKPNGPIEIH
jgi:hypothetical protein